MSIKVYRKRARALTYLLLGFNFNSAQEIFEQRFLRYDTYSCACVYVRASATNKVVSFYCQTRKNVGIFSMHPLLFSAIFGGSDSYFVCLKDVIFNQNFIAVLNFKVHTEKFWNFSHTYIVHIVSISHLLLTYKWSQANDGRANGAQCEYLKSK